MWLIYDQRRDTKIIMTYKERLQKIKNELVELRPPIIAIDGEDGVGKSTIISPSIADDLNAVIFSVDNYLNKKKDGYKAHINCEKLKQEIIRTKKSRHIIVEGVMISLILKKLELTPDYYIYVCNQGWRDEWLGENGNYSKNFEDVVLNIENEVNVISKSINPTTKYTLGDLRKEIYEYTYSENPFKKAQFVLIVD